MARIEDTPVLFSVRDPMPPDAPPLTGWTLGRFTVLGLLDLQGIPDGKPVIVVSK